MGKNRAISEEEYYDGEFSEYLPHDTIGEMEYRAKKSIEEKNTTKVAKAVLVVACIGLICALIDCYIEKIEQ